MAVGRIYLEDQFVVLNSLDKVGISVRGAAAPGCGAVLQSSLASDSPAKGDFFLC